MEWTKNQQDQFTRLYSQLEGMPNYSKDRAYKELFAEQLPFEESKSRLEKLISEAKGGGLESKLDMTAVAAAVVLIGLIAGIPYPVY